MRHLFPLHVVPAQHFQFVANYRCDWCYLYIKRGLHACQLALCKSNVSFSWFKVGLMMPTVSTLQDPLIEPHLILIWHAL